HVFGLVLIVLVAFVVAYNRNDDMPIETVGLAGGGGGNPLGVGPASGAGSTGGLVDATKPREQPKDARLTDKANPDDPLTVAATDLFAGITHHPHAQRQVDKI